MAAKEVAVKKQESKALALPTDLDSAWGAENIDTKDILIPRILLMQGQSDFVADGKAKVGDLVKSTSGEVYGNGNTTVAFIPLMQWKDWTVETYDKGKWKFHHVEKTPVSEEREWSDEKGLQWRRNTNLNFFVLLTKDLEREREVLSEFEKNGTLTSTDFALMPCHLKFTRTSFNIGKTLITHFAQMQGYRKPPAIKMFKLGSKKLDGDSGPYQILQLESGEMTSLEHLKTAKKWYDILRVSQDKIQVHSVDDAVEAVATDTGEELM